MNDADNAGSRNLLILGVITVGIAILTTTVSLIIYHNSGDIYLDRSRPGFLPDESEVRPQPEENYSFSSTGTITENDINDYIKHYEEEVDMIDDLESPFSETPLSDSALGIPTGE